MKDLRKIAYAYKERGLTVIPVNSLKQPTVNWNQYQDKIMSDQEIEKYFKNVYGLALICGGEGQVYCLDIDLKHSLVDNFIEELKEAVPNEILKKLWVQETPSGGYHWIFKCEDIGRNEKLANRLTTAEEKHNTYIEAFNNVKLRNNALKIASNDKTRVILETRGNGGYFVVAPTQGYKKVYGSLQYLTKEEKDHLFEICRSFNEYSEEKKNFELNKYQGENNPFEEYNDRGDSLSLLLQHGWQVVSESSGYVRLKRPGSTHSASSALFDKNTRIFNVFSTSTMFDVNTGYTPVNVFIALEANGDTKEAYKKLIDLGYGKQSN